MKIIKKTDKYAILRNCAITDDEVVALGGEAYCTRKFARSEEEAHIEKCLCNVLGSWGLDTEEDVVIVFDKEWAAKIHSEISNLVF
jgi:hypothetical protein